MIQLYQENQLHARLQELLASCESIDVAVAWIRRGKALDSILEFASAHPGTV